MKRNHTLALIAVVAAALSLVPLSTLLRTRAAEVVAATQEDGDVRGFLSGPVTARAAGRGNPWVSLRDGLSAPALYQESSKLVQQLKEDQTHALSVGSADFDEDGVPDLVAGYAGRKGGVIAVQRGDADTIFTNTREAILNRARLQAAGASSDDIQSPFFVSSRTFDVSSAPQFLGTGDFDGDGHRDVVTAETGSGAFVLLPGDGRGGFAPARSVALPGKVTAFATGDVNRIDGLADIIVAVKGSGAPKLLIYEGGAGAVNAAPEMITLPSESKSIALGQLDDNFPVDMAVASGRELIIIRGRDRKHSTADGKKLDAEPPKFTRLAVSFSIASLAVGDFTGDLRQEIALLSDDGLCHVFSRTASSGSNWQEASAVALPVQKNEPAASLRVLLPVRISCSPKDDLLLLDQAGRQLQILINESATLSDESGTKGPASLRLRVSGTIDFDSEPVAVVGMRLNSDALNDLVVLRSNASAPTVIMTSPAAAFSVINTNDSGAGSLRQAMLDADLSPGADSISFIIPGSGTQTITPLSPLPALSEPVTIDGTTQNPGSTTPPIQLDGGSAGVGVNALSVAGGNTTVRGLVINRFDGIGVELSGSGSIVDGNFIGTNAGGTAGQGNGDKGVLINSGSGHLIGGTVTAARNVISANAGQGVEVLSVLSGPAMNHQVQGNFIGTNATGTIGLGNRGNGVEMLSSTGNIINCTVGGTTAGARNVISANSGVGVQFNTVGTSNLVQGNLIGTNASGSNALGNLSSGVAINEANDCTVGGTVAGAGNVISGNGFIGVLINSATSSGNRVQGNRIGTRADGVTSLPNSSDGVRVRFSASNNTIGGAAGEGNIIAFNFGAGVMVESGTGNVIQSNSIFSNTGLGIDLGLAGVTPNDAGDGDTGANNLQNFPVLTSSNGAGGGSVNIQGTLNSNSNTTFTLDFFSSASCDASGNGEGRTSLGSASVTTNGVGNVTFNVTVVASASAGESITATATNPQGDTSEFSACVPYGAADLGVTKVASSATIIAGSSVTYTITLVNNGPDPASSTTVTDILPAPLTFVSCASTGSGVCGGSGNNRIVSFSSLASGASATITIVAKLDCSVSNGLSIGNTASVTSTVRDPVSGNNSSSVNFTASNPFSIAPTGKLFGDVGNESSFAVTAGAGCNWTSSTTDAWIFITSEASGTANGVVTYGVRDNFSGVPRQGTITVGGLTFTIVQDGGTLVDCVYVLNPSSVVFNSAGGNGSVQIITEVRCAWEATTVASWITLTSQIVGIGTSTVTYNVKPNPGVSGRAGVIVIGGQSFRIKQKGN